MSESIPMCSVNYFNETNFAESCEFKNQKLVIFIKENVTLSANKPFELFIQNIPNPDDPLCHSFSPSFYVYEESVGEYVNSLSTYFY